ncbi:MFS transporter [Chloroflexota bacterium]
MGHHLSGALLVPLLPFIRDDFALDYTQAGWLVSAFMVSYGIGQIPGGWLADRIGSRAVITIGVSGVALFGLLVGLSPSYIIMGIFLVLLGITGGGYHPASIPLISASVDSEKRGRALGLHQIGGTASHFLGPVIAVAFATALGWRGSFIATSIPIIIFGIVFYVLLNRWGYPSKAEQAISEGHSETPPTPGRLGRLVAFLILSIVGQILIVAVISFIPLFLVDEFGISEKAAAALLALAYSAGFWAGPLGGYLSDRIGTVPVMLAVTLITGPVIYLLNHVPYGLGLGALLVLIGMSLDSRMPVSEAYISSHTSARRRSTVLGIYYFGSRGGPGVMTPILGYLIDRFGFYTSFTAVGATLVAVTLACSVFLRDRRN